ncbi:hypothetical protein K438DRAFT_1984814 [Mycena galopus ATCC 62051]|nr:hypothetical protein K438DRAFT_1984814 [Mycena galopus ATCC 62051]
MANSDEPSTLDAHAGDVSPRAPCSSDPRCLSLNSYARGTLTYSCPPTPHACPVDLATPILVASRVRSRTMQCSDLSATRQTEHGVRGGVCRAQAMYEAGLDGRKRCLGGGEEVADGDGCGVEPRGRVGHVPPLPAYDPPNLATNSASFNVSLLVGKAIIEEIILQERLNLSVIAILGGLLTSMALMSLTIQFLSFAKTTRSDVQPEGLNMLHSIWLYRNHPELHACLRQVVYPTAFNLRKAGMVRTKLIVTSLGAIGSEDFDEWNNKSYAAENGPKSTTHMLPSPQKSIATNCLSAPNGPARNSHRNLSLVSATLHSCLVAIHLALVPLVSWAITTIATTFVTIYLAGLLFVTQTLAFQRSLHQVQMITTTHDNIAAWDGIGSALTDEALISTLRLVLPLDVTANSTSELFEESTIFHSVVPILDSNGNTSPLTDGAQLFACSAKPAKLIAIVDSQSRELIYIDQEMNNNAPSIWEPFDGNSNNSTNSNSGPEQTLADSWESWYPAMPTSPNRNYVNNLNNTVAEEFFIEQLDLPRTNVTLREFENALSGLVASMYWTLGHIAPPQVFTPASLTPNGPPPVEVSLLQGSAEVTETTVEARFDLSTTAVIILLNSVPLRAPLINSLIASGILASAILLLVSLQFLDFRKSREHDDDVVISGMGLLHAIWLYREHPELEKLLEQVVEPTDENLRRAGMVQMGLAGSGSGKRRRPNLEIDEEEEEDAD